MVGATPPKTENRPHVLFAILDWGLGHATRSWPLILSARQSGAKVTVASCGVAAVWLQSRMTEVVDAEIQSGAPQGPWCCIKKPGKEIQYALGRGTLLKIATQMPAFLSTIAAEQNWMTELMAREHITHVVSDNCYGVHPHQHKIPSALISHQISPPVPWWARWVANRQVRQWSRPFSEVWVPDLTGGMLAGRLSVSSLPTNRFVGPLSRFMATSNQGLATKKQDVRPKDAPPLVGLVSGPEPQRTLMEKALLSCFARDGRPALIFSGKPQGKDRNEGRVRIVHHASDARIQLALLHADCIVCRSGYSSLMDLVALRAVAVLVPTPGQPEQEQLAHHWAAQWGWKTVQQKHLHHFCPVPTQGIQPVSVDELSNDPFLWMRDWLKPNAAVRPKLQA